MTMGPRAVTGGAPPAGMAVAGQRNVTRVERGAGAAPMTAEERDKMMKDLEVRRKEAEAKLRTVEYRVYYSDFKSVGGVQLPHRIQRAIDGKPTEEMVFDTIKVNRRSTRRSSRWPSRAAGLNQWWGTSRDKPAGCLVCVVAGLGCGLRHPPCRSGPPRRGRIIVTVSDQSVCGSKRSVRVISRSSRRRGGVKPVMTGGTASRCSTRFPRAATRSRSSSRVRDRHRARRARAARAATPGAASPCRFSGWRKTSRQPRQTDLRARPEAARSFVLTREQTRGAARRLRGDGGGAQGMSPPGSVLRVDGFTGGRLPPKAQIRSNPAAAHGHVRARTTADGRHDVHRHHDDAGMGP